MVPSRRWVTVVALAAVLVQIPVVGVLLWMPMPAPRRHLQVLVAVAAASTVAPLGRLHRSATWTTVAIRYVRYAWWRVRAMADSGAMRANPFFCVLRLLLHLRDLGVELVSLFRTVVLEAHHRVHAAYPRQCQRDCQEDCASVALLFLDLVFELTHGVIRCDGGRRCADESAA